jgi:SAM-dependent methyltransferase
MSQEFTYSGSEELSAMEHMVNYNNHIISLLQKSHPCFEQVLDFGAGIGTMAELMQPCCKELVCVEIDKSQQQRLNDKGFNVVDDLAKIPDNSQSLIYSINVLEHIEDDYAAIKQLNVKLAPGATLFIYVPAFNLLYTAMDKKVGHYRRYNKKRLKAVFHAANLEIKDMLYVDSLGFFASLLFKYIGSKQGEISPTQLQFYDKWVFPVSKFLDIFLRYFLGKNLLVIAKKRVLK